MSKPLLLKVVGQMDDLKENTMRIFPRYLGHYSLKNEEGKWTLHKLMKNDSCWIFIGPSYMKRLLAGGQISVDEDILEMEKIE